MKILDLTKKNVFFSFLKKNKIDKLVYRKRAFDISNFHFNNENNKKYVFNFF